MGSVAIADNRSGRGAAFAVIVAACLISLIGFGTRASFGLYLEPMTVANGWSRETFGLAMAIQNLLWGVGVPVAGAIGVALGIVAYKRRWFETLLWPILNVMQALPHFSYMIPVAIFIGIGHKAGTKARVSSSASRKRWVASVASSGNIHAMVTEQSRTNAISSAALPRSSPEPTAPPGCGSAGTP